ncbi:alpha-1-antitrypsin [Chelonia mydas]|uniref:alpha-1-antitrypsin n=1 Tax=Chelonia mydas TaxID=8469 RepID=UPI0018A1D325|nr:alpha-1-antitrypsin [Chelonia mydas]XP_043405758.1 alpha-1-antitrypsin [Chelonia mydas]
MKSILCLCVLLAGLHAVVLSHHVPEHHNDQDGQTDNNPPQQLSPVGGKVITEHMTFMKVVASNADFAFRFYKQIKSEAADKNIFFSPLSISTAFAMLTLGAKSATLSQILQGLSFNLTEIEEREIHEGFHQLLQMLNHPDSEIQLNMGNALFIDDQLKLLEKFLEDVKTLYESETFPTNFQNSAEAEKQINDYIENKTHGKIANLVKDLDPLAVMILINYIFFKAHWENPFNSLFTKEDDFFVDAETSVKVNMMSSNKQYNTHHDEELSCWVVEIPYKGNAAAIFILPDEGKMEQVEDALLKKTVTKWTKSLQQREIVLYIPAFSVSGTYDVKELFEKMGVVDVFTDKADLSGMTGHSSLKVSKALHKAVVDVHENGTEAAAVTIVEITYTSLPFPQPLTIKFNRPFLMIIVDKNTQSILFMGKIVNPTKK